MFDPHVAIAFYDGEYLSADRVAIPYWDLGFAQGVSAVEQIRTYGGRLPLLDHHLRRLDRGLRQLELAGGISLDEIRTGVHAVVEHNHRQIPRGSDLGVCVVVSAGAVASFVPETVSPSDALRPKVLIHSFPLPWNQWRFEFQHGVRLATTEIPEISAASQPHDFKHRSRLHYFLAQRDVSRRRPGCRALLKTLEGYVADSPTAGVLMYGSGTWVSPAPSQVLHSVTVEVFEALARTAGIGFERRAIEFLELSSAEEIVYCSTPTGLLPVVELDGEAIGEGRPGPQFAQMAGRWSDLVELDYRRQATRNWESGAAR